MAKRLALLLILMIGTTGCGLATVARISVNQRLVPDDLAFLQSDQTTLSQLVERLGSPDEITASDDVWIATYHFLDAKYTRVNYGTLLTPWAPITPDMITEGLDTGMNALEIVLDSSWHVQHVAFSQHHDSPLRFRLWPFARQTPNTMPIQPARHTQANDHEQLSKPTPMMVDP